MIIQICTSFCVKLLLQKPTSALIETIVAGAVTENQSTASYQLESSIKQHCDIKQDTIYLYLRTKAIQGSSD